MKLATIKVSIILKQPTRKKEPVNLVKPREGKAEKSAMSELSKARGLVQEAFQEETEVNRLFLGLELE